MKLRILSLVVAIAAMSVSSVSAQNFFFSDVGLGGTATNGDFELNLEAGETARAYLYYDIGPDGAEQDIVTGGFDFDFSFDTAGIANFAAAEVLDFEVFAGGAPFSFRWQQPDDEGNGAGFGPATVTDDAVTGFIGLSVTDSTGIAALNRGPVFEDQGFSAASDAFLLGFIDITGGDVGTATLQLDFASIVSDGTDLSSTPFSALTVNVVPEPAAASVLALGLVGLVARRRR